MFLGGRCPPKGGMGRFLSPLYPPFEGELFIEEIMFYEKQKIH